MVRGAVAPVASVKVRGMLVNEAALGGPWTVP